jgi:hypothetical protein
MWKLYHVYGTLGCKMALSIGLFCRRPDEPLKEATYSSVGDTSVVCRVNTADSKGRLGLLVCIVVVGKHHATAANLNLQPTHKPRSETLRYEILPWRWKADPHRWLHNAVHMEM